MKNTIGIGVTAYREDDLLKECLDSIESQSCSDYSLVLVLDGGASRGTRRIYEQCSIPGVVKLSNNINRGPYYCRAMAIEAVKSDWYMQLDGDDEITEGAIQILIQKIKHNSHADYISIGATYTGKSAAEYRRPTIPTLDSLRKGLMGAIISQSPFKKSLYYDVGGYDPSLCRGGADWLFWYGAIYAGALGVALDEPIYIRKSRRNSNSNTRRVTYEEIARRIYSIYPASFSDPAEVEDFLNTAIARDARHRRRKTLVRRLLGWMR